MHDSTRGGNDTLTGGDGSFNNLYGDARIMDGDSRGGNDTLNGGQGICSPTGATSELVYGDAFEMHDHARGGNDTLIGGDFACISFSMATRTPWQTTARAATTR